jgi:hypothetical protein
MVASGLQAQLCASDANISVSLVTDKELQTSEAVRYNSVVSSTSTNLAASALLLKRVPITSELVGTNVLDRLSLLAAEDGGIVCDLDVNGEVFPFLITPARVYETKELADVIPVGHNVDGDDVK